MAARARETLFFCTSCGHESHKWIGQCPGCGAWNTFAEQPRAPRGSSGVQRRAPATLVPVSEAAATPAARRATGIEGVDRVLGGGLVAGSLVLLAGEPGIGKSTLFLQVAAAMARPGAPTVYVTGEESAEQVALRARRTGSVAPDVLLLAETSCDAVIDQLRTVAPAAVVVDSIQTMVVDEVDALAGSVAQVRQVAARFQAWAKTGGAPVVLIGHVTKEGTIAGPKLLEHLVDVVVSLDGEPGHDLRLLRAAKNRFGTVAELALFAMGERGMEGVLNPSAWLLEDRQAGAPGSAVAVALEGTAPLLVEVQALVAPSALGTPRRVAQGFEGSRLALLLAVLERHAGLSLADRDVYVNLVGGIALSEPALDLAVAAALVSSVSDRPLAADLAVFGEIGLLGEVRGVSRAAERAREAAALGFGRLAVAGRDAEARLALPAEPIRRVADVARLVAREGG